MVYRNEPPATMTTERMNSIFHSVHISIRSVIACWMVRFVAHNSIFGGCGWQAARLCLASALGKKFTSPTLYLGRGSFFQMKRIRTKIVQNRNRMWNHNQKLWVHSHFQSSFSPWTGYVMAAATLPADPGLDGGDIFHKRWMKNETQPSVYGFLKCSSWEFIPYIFYGFLKCNSWEFIPYIVDPDNHAP